ncbi:MAG TPA: glycine dehydrogenase (aminomethyl-transferring), partial [Phycisphaerales bacterium]|nr:glycine dehydrogenase (aminomethyl-transferring) [Phycisphaerales bacterium]
MVRETTSSSTAGDVSPFTHRHVGPDRDDVASMLEVVGKSTLNELMASAMPSSIVSQTQGNAPARGEQEALELLHDLASRNRVMRSCIGMGYHDVIVPPVIQRSIFENPCWYTQYTPYQSEIAQGRLEALLNFQTMVSDLTALPVANASLLDEGTAAAEAMIMCRQIAKGQRMRFVVSDTCHPQTLSILAGRAEPLGIELIVCDPMSDEADLATACGVLVQVPDTMGTVTDWRALASAAKDAGAVPVMCADILSLTLLAPPGECGFDIAIGSTQRLGVPMGFGGPHAAYIATQTAYVRRLPGRIIGVSRDRTGQRALRMAIQTREQHIKRDRATSNICTAQVLLAIMAGMYALWHGPEGLRRIASRIHMRTQCLAASLDQAGVSIEPGARFDTVVIHASSSDDAAGMVTRACEAGYNIRRFDNGTSVGISLDETTTESDVAALLAACAPGASLIAQSHVAYPDNLARSSGYLADPIFGRCRSETEMLRYITQLQGRDLSLAHSMIPLGSCTMKLNATSEMMPA